MARYLLVRVDDNKKVTPLRTKLDGVEGIETVGIFFCPTKFCEGCQKMEREPTSIRNAKTGTWHCPVCKLVKKVRQQSPINFLEGPDMPPQCRGVYLNIEEPYTYDRASIYGAEVIDRLNQNVAEAAIRIQRARRRRGPR